MIIQKITFMCDQCGKLESTRYQMLPYSTLAHHYLPYGWAEIRGLIICDEHEITILDPDPERQDCQ